MNNIIDIDCIDLGDTIKQNNAVIGNTALYMSNEDYHAKREFLSASSIKTLLKNPYEFLHPIRIESKAFSIGSATHSLILEPQKFNDEFVVAPDINKRTKAGREEFALFEKENANKCVLSKEDYKTSKNMSDAVLATPEVRNILQNGIAECSFFSEIDGIKVKCRPDYYREDIGLVLDVKTVQDASPDSFIRDVANFGYYIQAQFYMDTLKSLGYPAKKFLFLVVEKKEPHMVGLYELDVTSLEFGRDEYMRAFSIYKEIDKYKSPIYKDTVDKSVVQTLTLPNYVYYKRGA